MALASFLTIPVPARILLLLLAVLTGVTGIFVAAQLEWRARILRVPALQGAVCAVDAGLCEGLPHPDPPQADLPALRAHRDVPPPDCAVGKGENDKGAANENRLRPLLFLSGGNVWELNPPMQLLTAITGFEDQRAHQHPSAPKCLSSIAQKNLFGKKFCFREWIIVELHKNHGEGCGTLSP